MNKKKPAGAAAVILIGSDLLMMRVVQLKKGRISDLDRLEYPFRLGREVFQTGEISFDSVAELSAALRGYTSLLQEYGVTQYRVIATTALREARNRDYVLDQLHIQNNMDVEILEENREKALICFESLRDLTLADEAAETCALLCHIGAGSISLSLFSSGAISFFRSIPTGAVKLHDMLAGSQNSAGSFYEAAQEYLTSLLDCFSLPVVKGEAVRLVLTGREVWSVARLCGAAAEKGCYHIEAAGIRKLADEVRDVAPEHVGDKFGITAEHAETLTSALAICMQLLSLTGCETVTAPETELWDLPLREMLLPKSADEFVKHLEQNAFSCVQAEAARYRCDTAHAQWVRAACGKLFDKMKGVHGLGGRERLLLEIAAMLHDCGYYASVSEHHYAARELISRMELYGLTKEERIVAAFVAGSCESHTPLNQDAQFASFRRETRMTVSKLSAMFRLSDALDRAHQQRLKGLKIKLSQDKLSISGSSESDMLLEKWAFRLCAPFFREVFGIVPVLAVRPSGMP